MKPTLIVLIVGLLAVGCMTPEQKQKILRDSMVGEYELKRHRHSRNDQRLLLYPLVLAPDKSVLLENGIVEFYNNGTKGSNLFRWSIVGNELRMFRRGRGHTVFIHGIEGKIGGAGDVIVYRINKDRSITYIARILLYWSGRKLLHRRTNHSKENQYTLQKIK